MKKKIIAISITVFLFLGLCILYYLYQRPTKWNYDGTAVVLSFNSRRTFIGTTNVSFDLECYGFGKYFLGDIRAGIIEQEQHFYGEPDDTKGMMTDYRYCRNTMGEEYFKKKKNREKFQMETTEARTFWNGESILNTKMLCFDWTERFGGRPISNIRLWRTSILKQQATHLL